MRNKTEKKQFNNLLHIEHIKSKNCEILVIESKLDIVVVSASFISL